MPDPGGGIGRAGCLVGADGVVGSGQSSSERMIHLFKASLRSDVRVVTLRWFSTDADGGGHQLQRVLLVKKVTACWAIGWYRVFRLRPYWLHSRSWSAAGSGKNEVRNCFRGHARSDGSWFCRRRTASSFAPRCLAVLPSAVALRPQAGLAANL